jgi:hypothetical protein
VRLDTGRLLLAGPRVPSGPLSLLVARLPAGGLRVGTRAEVTGGWLIVGRLRIALSAARTPPRPQPLALRDGWRASLVAALARASAPPTALEPGLRALADCDLSAAARALGGRGDGLTPAGDDVLAGAAGWWWHRGRPVVLDGSGCAPLGLDYLRCAERGELPQPAGAVLAAICAGDAPAAARRACRLRTWGASSGAALLWGMAAAASHVPAVA